MEDITLKAARVNRGLTQDEAAKLLGVSVSTLQKYEAGKSFPNVPTINKMEQIYGIKYEHIIFLPTNNALSVT